jgi:hypothetical protein
MHGIHGIKIMTNCLVTLRGEKSSGNLRGCKVRMEKLRKTTKNLILNTWFPGRGLNTERLKHQAAVFPEHVLLNIKSE